MSDWTGRNIAVRVLYSHAGIATQLLVESGDARLLLDCGDGTLRDTLGTSLQSLVGVAISHGHYDHMGGLWSLLGGLRCVGRTGSFAVVGPPGCDELERIVDGFLAVYHDTLPYELARHTPGPDEPIEVGPFTLSAFEVAHAGSIAGARELPRIPAYGYCVQVGDERVVYSGDTTEIPELERRVAGADLAVIEATLESGGSPVHLSVDYARRVGETAKAHLLIHSIKRERGLQR